MLDHGNRIYINQCLLQASIKDLKLGCLSQHIVKHRLYFCLRPTFTPSGIPWVGFELVPDDVLQRDLVSGHAGPGVGGGHVDHAQRHQHQHEQDHHHLDSGQPIRDQYSELSTNHYTVFTHYRNNVGAPVPRLWVGCHQLLHKTCIKYFTKSLLKIFRVMK